MGGPSLSVVFVGTRKKAHAAVNSQRLAQKVVSG